MSSGADAVPDVWRPSIATVLSLVLVSVLSLPLFSLYLFKISQNQLIQQTEMELIGQSAVLAAVLQNEIEARTRPDIPLGTRVMPQKNMSPDEIYQPVGPILDLANHPIMPPRPDARPTSHPADDAFIVIGTWMTPALLTTQKVTLAGFRLLDPAGIVIAGRGEVGLSLAHIVEVEEALQGRFRSVLRQRASQSEAPPLGSISRGSDIRVFVAMPVLVREQVAAVVYASRTPRNTIKFLYDERMKFGIAIAAMLALTFVIGLVFHRAITGPMHGLIAHTNAVGNDVRGVPQPPKNHGTKELAQLSQSFLDMAEKLRIRSNYISTFATHVSHELKSPLTSIQGAAELLRDDIGSPASVRMSDADCRKFLDNVIADADRLTRITTRLRDLARAESPVITGACRLSEVIADLRLTFEALEVRASGDLGTEIRISAENAAIILSNLADNAVQHNAKRLEIRALKKVSTAIITIQDDGMGVSENNRARIFDSFFTTRRDAGGTGMGLAIVRAMLTSHHGTIRLLHSSQKSEFEITIPTTRN